MISDELHQAGQARGPCSMYIDPPLVSSPGTGLDAQPLPGQRQGQARPFPQPFPVLVLALAKPLGFADPPPTRQKQDRALLGTLHPACLVYPALQVPRTVHVSPTKLIGRGWSPLGSAPLCSGLCAPQGPTWTLPSGAPSLGVFSAAEEGSDTCVWLAFSR